MTDEWARVAETVKRRRSELGLSQRAAARLADDLSPTTWNNLERHHAPMSPLSVAAICKALRWTTDSIDRILAGGEPEVDQTAAPRAATLIERVTALEGDLAEVREELRTVLGLLRGTPSKDP